MWLLSTDRAELQFFASPEESAGGYAILSHVWGNASEEDTFQSVQALAKKCRDNAAHTDKDSTPENTPTPPPSSNSLSDGAENPGRSNGPTNPRDLISPKIRNFLIVAESHGYYWAWADTCCIDKTSSAELTEAINSMFRYYALAEVCYVYLRDVPAVSESSWTSSFGRSAWHTRGWTLQELLTPTTVVFLAQDWIVLGDRRALAAALERATGVPAAVLRLERDVAETSVAQRMSWAARRETTRVEDRAYCLFGLFGINMPTLYGEGENAFYRLQEEILRTSVDASLFAWGPVRELRSVDEAEDLLSESGLSSDCSPYLFAESPSMFVGCSGVVFDDSESIADVSVS